MNKNQFLTELNQYLTFLSPAERGEIISGYTAEFDSVPEEEEAALILSLGTPTKIAIDLKRQKESGVEFAPAAKEPEEEDEALESVSEPEESIAEPETVTEAEPEAEDNSPDEPESPPEAKPETVKKRSIPASIGAGLLAILVSVFFLAFVAVGIYFVAIMGNLLLTGLQSLSSSTNALLLFGGGLVAGAFGILLIWLAIWSAIKLIARLFGKAYSGSEA